MFKEHKGKLAGLVAVIALFLFVKFLPFERETSGITEWLYKQSEEQLEMSDEITSAAVSTVEGDGSFVGEHQVNGANWSIPNLLRHWFGLD